MDTSPNDHIMYDSHMSRIDHDSYNEPIYVPKPPKERMDAWTFGLLLFGLLGSVTAIFIFIAFIISLVN